MHMNVPRELISLMRSYLPFGEAKKQMKIANKILIKAHPLVLLPTPITFCSPSSLHFPFASSFHTSLFHLPFPSRLSPFFPSFAPLHRGIDHVLPPQSPGVVDKDVHSAVLLNSRPHHRCGPVTKETWMHAYVCAWLYSLVCR